MKLLISLVVISAIVLGSCQIESQNNKNNPLYTGQPGCLTEEEIATALYPHYRIKRAYWRCSVLGQAATLEFCPVAQGFLAPARACVPWAEWYWTPTEAPPSQPEISEINN